MAERDRTDALVAELRSVARRLEFPPTPAIAPTVVARISADAAARRARPPFPGIALWSRRRLIAAIALGLLLLGGAAVAARLAIGAVGVEVIPSLAPTPPAEAPSAFGRPVPIRQVRRAVGFDVVWPAGFGAPDDAFVIRSGSGLGAVAVLAWHDATGQRIPSTPWDVVLIELPGSAEIATKTVLPTSIDTVRVDGERAFWITGPHDLGMRGAFGGEVVRVRGNALIWQGAPGVTYRLESMLTEREAVSLAETMP